MRPIVLAIIAIQLGLALPAVADDAGDGDRSISDVLPLFNKNNCETIGDPADQLLRRTQRRRR
jgi:hypothetical protein